MGNPEGAGDKTLGDGACKPYDTDAHGCIRIPLIRGIWGAPTG
jgi:hypothetical protein